MLFLEDLAFMINQKGQTDIMLINFLRYQEIRNMRFNIFQMFSGMVRRGGDKQKR